jgi:DNA-binding transcriptional regulator YiaG
MPNIANVLKAEIARVARKEVKGQTQQFKQAATQYRAEITALKRRAQALEKQIARLLKATAKKGAPEKESVEPGASRLRFSAKGLAAQRKRLGLSAAEVGALVGVSAQSVYKWEEGKSRPRARQLPAIASLRGLGKKEAAARLSALTPQTPPQ